MNTNFIQTQIPSISPLLDPCAVFFVRDLLFNQMGPYNLSTITIYTCTVTLYLLFLALCTM